MARKGSYVLTARVVGVASQDTAEVVLANGHRLLAHCEKNCMIEIKDLLPDDEIMIVISAHDLSKGRIIARNVQIR